MAVVGGGPQPTAQPSPGPPATSQLPKRLGAAVGQGESFCKPAFGLLLVSLLTPDGNVEQATDRENPCYIFQA